MKSIFEDNESNVRSYCRKFDAIFTKSKDANIFDIDGQKYIDFFSGAGALNYGHNNEYIKSKIIKYIEDDRIMHALDFYTEAKMEFISSFNTKILKPRNLNYKLMFCGSTGTNAVEASIKLARKITKRTNIFAFSGAFHGMTLGSLALTTDRTSRAAAGVSLNNVNFIPFQFGSNNSFDSIDYMESILTDDHSGIDKPAAVIFETIQAEGGVYVATEDWIRRLSQFCQKHDILLICDDIQVGCGRSGTFFSFEHSGIKPDMVVLSKSISGYGFPMSLLLIKPELDVWKPAEHNGTFRGNQLAFVGANAAIDIWHTTEFQRQILNNSLTIRQYLETEIKSIDAGIEIRGCGMIWAIDLSNVDKINIHHILNECFSRKLIIEVCGRKDMSIKILPPLAINDIDLLAGLDVIRDSIIFSLRYRDNS